VYFTLGSLPISELIGFGDTAYRGIGTPFQSPAQNTPPAVSVQLDKSFQENKYLKRKHILLIDILKIKGKHLKEE
jgi:hypothetical protein